MQNSVRSIHWLLALVVSSGLPIAAQDASGRIIGVVTDPSGSLIPTAKVTITNVETEISSDTTTNSIDGRTGGAGILRGQMRYNLDLGITKDTKITERFGFQIFGQAFNVLNHMMFNDPNLNLQDQANFGTPSTLSGTGGQYNAQTLGGSLASANYTRIIQVGLRVYF